MATLTVGLATSHLSAITRTPAAEDTPQTAAFRAGFGVLAEALHAARPDAAILISPDHLNRFFLDNMPAFCVGLFDSFRGPVERNTGMPDREVPSAPGLAAHLLAHGLEHGVDFARAEEWVVDHGFMVPLFMLDPEARIPVVPVHVNCAAPPYPGVARCYEVGRAIAAALAAWDSDKRVAVIAAGGCRIRRRRPHGRHRRRLRSRLPGPPRQRLAAAHHRARACADRASGILGRGGAQLDRAGGDICRTTVPADNVPTHRRLGHRLRPVHRGRIGARRRARLNGR